MVNRQLRKHVTQMTKYERRILRRAVVGRDHWRLSEYSASRMVMRGISKERILSVIKKGEIIEFNRKDGKNRLLIRETEAVDSDHLCAVVNISNGIVVTVYYNSIKDNHDTLDWDVYDKDLNIWKILRGESE